MAANTPTLNKLIELIQLVILNHYMVKDFRYGPLWDRNALRDLKTPYIWLEEVSTNVSMGNGSHMTGQTKFRIYCLDRIQKDESNYIEILSDTKYICESIFSELDQHPLFVDLGLNIPNNSSVTLTPIYEETDMYNNGYMMEFQLQYPIRYTPCNIPINSLNGVTYSLNNN